MFRRALVPLDGSPVAETILNHLPAFLAPDGEAVLLHVLPEPHPVPGQGHKSWLALQRGAEDYLQAVDRRDLAVPLKTFVDVGEPGQRILSVAASIESDLVALVTHTWKGLPRAGLGSISRTVLRGTRAAVLLVQPGLSTPRRPRTILLPLEGPGWRPSEIEPVLPVAARHGAKLVFLHVESPEPDPLDGVTQDPPFEMAANDRLRRYREAADYAKSFGVEARSLLVRGDPTREILAHAKSQNADLLALTSRRRRGLERLLAGSVAEKVIRSAECPVLVFRKAAVLSPSAPLNGVR